MVSKLLPLRVPAREIPVPAHLSPAAQAWFAPFGTGIAFPAHDDLDAWRKLTALVGSVTLEMYSADPPFVGKVDEISEGDARGFEITPAGVGADDRRVYVDIHGGGLVMGAGEACKAAAIRAAGIVKARVVSPDYRMPPDHPYPTGLNDCMAFYRRLLRDHEPSQIIVGGISAGGNLAAALVLRARDEGLPLPAAAVLTSPELDLTESGDSFNTHRGLNVVDGFPEANLLYAGGADLAHPYLSPLFGDVAKGFPPTFLSSGTRDLFLSNTVRFHRQLRAANVQSELHVLEAASHGAFGILSPEMDALNVDVRDFCDRAWGR